MNDIERKALVERLREGVDNDGYDFLIEMADADMREAADCIEAQAAEIEQWKVDYNELLLEAAKLRAALKNHSYTGEGWRPFKEIYESLREKG